MSVQLFITCDDVITTYESCFHQTTENQSVSQSVSEQPELIELRFSALPRSYSKVIERLLSDQSPRL